MGDIELIDDPARWEHFVAQLSSPSIMATHAVASAAAMLEDGGRPQAAVLELDGDIIFHTYIRRPCPYDPAFNDAISPYEFGGFWFTTEDASRRAMLARRFDTRFTQAAAASGLVCEFVRLHPLDDPAPLKETSYELVHAADHVIAWARDGHQALWEGIKKGKQQDIRIARRAGLTAEFGFDAELFTRLYHRNLDRIGAGAFYYFPAAYFVSMAPQLRMITIRDAYGDACAAQLWLRDKNRLCYFLSASVEEKRKLYPNDFAIDIMMGKAAAEGIDIIHLGGGGTSLHQYKSRFSPHRAQYFVAKKIFRPDTYERLASRLSRETSNPKTASFPAYRG